MSSWLKKPKATTVPTPIYNKTPELMAGAQKYLGAGYSQGIQDRNKEYAGAGTLANSLLDYGNNQLKLGGSIDPETEANIVRNSFQGAGRSGFTRFGSEAQTRGLTARDLGLSTMDLQNDRAKNAAGVLNMKEFQAPDYGSSLANAFLQSEMGNTQLGNDWISSQLAANEAVKGKDSFVGGLAKGLATTATYGALNNASSSL